MENDVIICRCMEVSKQEILDAIHDGADTVDGVKRRTHACMGLCQGKGQERGTVYEAESVIFLLCRRVHLQTLRHGRNSRNVFIATNFISYSEVLQKQICHVFPKSCRKVVMVYLRRTPSITS